MIQLDDVESVIQHRLEWRPHESSDFDENRRSTACYLNSEPLTIELSHSTSDINIKIVDFGVGM